MARRAPDISFSRLRGELVELPGGAVLVNDCYNANPISMRAALEYLASLEVGGRRIAVLGGMAELGPGGAAYHRQAAESARALGIEPIVGVGELARDYGPDRWAPDPDAAVEAGRRAARRRRRGPGQGFPLGRARGVHRRPGGEARGALVSLPPGQVVTEVASTAIDRGEVLIAGMAAMLITIFLGPRFIEYLRVKEFGQQIREEGPRSTTARRGRRRWAG